MAQRDPKSACLGDGAAGTHHRDGGVELGNAHSAGRVLAVEAFVGETSAVVVLHRGLRGVGVQVNELLTCTDGQGDVKRRNVLKNSSSEKQMARYKKGDDGACSPNPTEEPMF